MEYGAWSMEYGVWSLEAGVWSLESGVWYTKHSNMTSPASNYPHIAELGLAALQYEGNLIAWSSGGSLEWSKIFLWGSGQPLKIEI